MAMGRAGAVRRRQPGRTSSQRGAASQRTLLALAASALLTAAVSLPMAYQAREARTQDRVDNPPGTPAAEVLGSSTVRPGSADSSTLFVRIGDDEPVLLDGATVPDGLQILLDLPGTVRADFRVDDGPVLTDEVAPFELDDGQPTELGPGSHSVTATATDASGTTTLHQAFFTVAD
jgi:hypothetical protein